MFQSLSTCEIFNSMDVVHKNSFKFFGFARAQIRNRIWARSNPIWAHEAGLRQEQTQLKDQPNRRGGRCSPSGIINIDDRETRAPPNLADAPRGRTPPTQSPGPALGVALIARSPRFPATRRPHG